MTPETVIRVSGVNHFFGRGELRKQVLHDVSIDVAAGEIVIMTGPSGSGKTTILTLIGGLRRVQEGSLVVLGHELNGLSDAGLREVRSRIGFVFQAHNLVVSLSARENVEMGLALQPDLPPAEREARARAMLEAVGLAHRLDHLPGQLSGGQKQRVAIARALAPGPQVVLADEPTAALDKQSGREVVDLMQDLAKKRGCAILLVTHDSRILDIADRIVHMEDGRISSFARSVADENRNLLGALAKTGGGEDLAEKVRALEPADFLRLLDETSREYTDLLATVDRIQDRASRAILDELIRAFTLRIGAIMEAERVTVFLLDEARGEIWSKVAQTDAGEGLEIRIPRGAGIVGEVFRTERLLNVPDAYAHPLFHREVDERTGFRTRSILCLPLADRRGRVFAAVQLVNRVGAPAFGPADEERFARLAAGVAVIMESWVRISGLQPRLAPTG